MQLATRLINSVQCMRWACAARISTRSFCGHICQDVLNGTGEDSRCSVRVTTRVGTMMESSEAVCRGVGGVAESLRWLKLCPIDLERPFYH